MSLELRLTMPLRYRDLDTLGHLNQAVYHELLEDARGALLSTIEGNRHEAWVLARVELDYRAEVRNDHSPVEVTSRVAEVGRKSITLEQELLRADGTLAAAGRCVIVAWDNEQRTSRELTDAERDALTGTRAGTA